MNKQELVDSLKSSIKDKVTVLEAAQAEGVAAIKELDEARASGDEGRVSDASAKVETVGADIKSIRDEIDAIEEQIGWFKEYKDEAEVPSVSDVKSREARELFESLKGQLGDNGEPRLSIGEHFANILQYRGIKRGMDVKDQRADTQLTVLLDKNARNAQEITEGKKSVKSIYSNHGAVMLDGSSNPVPGYMGFQTGLVLDPNIYGLLDPVEGDFESVITQATLTGNRIKFTRESSRDNNAASVLETIYNPWYSTVLQDGKKPEGIFTLEDVEVQDSKIAQFVTASDEILEDSSSVAGLIDNFLVKGVNQEKRRQLIVGTGASGQMRGILNQSGLLTRTHITGGAATDNIYDTFRRALTDLWFQGARVDSVTAIMNPRDMEIIDLTKDDMGRYLFNESDAFTRQLRNISIRTSVDMPQGTAVMGEFANNWVFYLRKALDVRMGYTGDQFIYNTNTILAEMRGLSLVRVPRKIIKVTALA